jgi:NADH-quinone oxidoreductase subunit L
MGLPWLGALILVFSSDENPKFQQTVAVVTSVAAGLAAVALIPLASKSIVFTFAMGAPFGDFSFRADGLGVFLSAVATVVGSLAVVFSINYMEGEAQLGRYYALVLFFIGAMAGLVLTTNLLLIFFFWEITAFCSYALISFNSDDPKAVAGGIKALIMTQFGGIGLLAGAMFIYSYTGSFEINDFLQNYTQMPASALSLVAFGFLIAAAAKSAQFPFQTWLPDAMEAPTPISALIHAATMVNAGVYLLARFYPAFKDVPGWTTTVMIVGMLSALLAAIMALVATDLKRVLAYSTVSQLGYMVYAIGAGGIFASQFHLLSHSVFKALLFLGAGAVIHAVGTRDMRKMGGLGKKMPVVRTVFVIGALALAGLPILNGFWSKELILEAGLKSGMPWGYGVMVFVAGLTALYTFRCVWLVFFGEPRSELHAHDAQPAMKVSLILLAVGTCTTWLLVSAFSNLLVNTVPFHEELEALSFGEFFKDVFQWPTLLALVVIALGLAAWWWRDSLKGLANALKGIGTGAENSFGFEDINHAIVNVTQSGAEALRATQTGLLNWNIFAILAAVIIVLAILAIGA